MIMFLAYMSFWVIILILIIKLFCFFSSSYYLVLLWVQDGFFHFKNISDEIEFDFALIALFSFAILMVIFLVIQGNN